MTIRPVDFATIQRTDDVGMMKHQQDAKPVVEQQNIQVEIKKQYFAEITSIIKHIMIRKMVGLRRILIIESIR